MQFQEKFQRTRKFTPFTNILEFLWNIFGHAHVIKTLKVRIFQYEKKPELPNHLIFGKKSDMDGNPVWNRKRR